MAGGEPLPTVLATTVVRSAHEGDSHGGAYLVDLETEAVRRVLDWNDGSIDWRGRGGGRGLRGIAFHAGEIYIAASDEIFVFDREFRVLRSFRNRYLRLCHEIDVADGRLYLTSTEYDSVLVYDLAARRFVLGYCLRVEDGRLRFGAFDPEAEGGPPPADTIHLNSVCVRDGAMHLCGLGLGHLLTIRRGRLSAHGVVPAGTHNARPFGGGVLANSTAQDAVGLFDPAGRPQVLLPVPRYERERLLHADLPADFARQAFARGLCVARDGETVIGGSSPATISAYRLRPAGLLKTVTLSLDVREAVHGLALWPFPGPGPGTAP